MKWFDCWKSIDNTQATFLFLNGGRGIGKTYSMLRGHYHRFVDNRIGKLLYVRMTTAELIMATSDETNQYKTLNNNEHLDIIFEPISGLKADVFDIVDNTNEEEPEIIGLGASLSNFGNLRGMDFSDFDIIFFDEYIPSDRAVKTAVVKKAGWLVYNLYETVNRNRELEGMPPVRMVFSANTFSMESSILDYFDVVTTFQGMQESGQMKATIPERGIYCERCSAPTVTEAKKVTAIYKALGHRKEVAQIALGNNFIDRSITLTRKVNINEYKPLVMVGDITLYRHKAGRVYYASKRNSDGVTKYKESESGAFKSRFGYIVKAGVATSCLFFDNASTMIQLLEYVQ